MAQRVAGVCYIKINGQQVDVKGGIEVPSTDVKREPVIASGRVSGYKETVLDPYIKLTAVFTPDFPMDEVKENTNMVITAEFANGKAYTLSGAFLKGDSPVNGEEGTLELDFGGTKGQWQ